MAETNLRDQMAMAALNGLLSSEYGYNRPNEYVAKRAYMLADEMMKARKTDGQR